MMRHVARLLPAYVHGQLTKRQRDRVLRHIEDCPACSAALTREQWIARELKATMPAIGRPEPGQLRRLWPRVRSQLVSVPPAARMLSSMGVLAMLALVFALSVSSLFGAPTHAIAAPNPLVPADIKATTTPVRTEDPTTETELAASQTASAPIIYRPSPAPPPGDANRFIQR